jgi:hypothetical protein
LGVACLITITAGAEPAKCLGPESCASSSCHGGAGPDQNQYLVWSTRDYHSRSFQTLTSRRSERIAEELKIQSASNDQACTVCHAPFVGLPAALRASDFATNIGVSCESCHNAAETWIRSHTRRDLSHEAHVASGVRDLRNAYVRANTCIGCHQNLDPKLRAAGHPELIFELDGQVVTQPRHWSESTNWSNARAWFVGQAVALREMSALQLKPAAALPMERWAALAWLVGKAAAEIDPSFALPKLPRDGSAPPVRQVHDLSDTIARQVAEMPWPPDVTRKILKTLAGTVDEFRDATVPQPVQGRRAECLVLALDRLWLSLPDQNRSAKADSELNHLFALVQSLPDFDAAKFRQGLSALAESL